jgi:hypothetical protein
MYSSIEESRVAFVFGRNNTGLKKLSFCLNRQVTHLPSGMPCVFYSMYWALNSIRSGLSDMQINCNRISKGLLYLQRWLYTVPYSGMRRHIEWQKFIDVRERRIIIIIIIIIIPRSSDSSIQKIEAIHTSETSVIFQKVGLFSIMNFRVSGKTNFWQFLNGVSSVIFTVGF